MNRINGVAVSAVLLLSACDQPLGPDGSTRRHTGIHAEYVAAAGDAIAYRDCYPEMDGYGSYSMLCDLNIRNADGSVSFVDRVSTDDPYGVSSQSRQTWSPDGSRIAYAAYGDIFATPVDGSSYANLTNALADDRSPAWSPDGGRIAFASDRDGPLELYLMNAADGSNVTRLTNGAGVSGSGSPTWSPDGSRIAFDCVVDAGNDDICAINTDGTGLVRLTSDATSDVEADFSPDGARIAFSASGVIAVMDANGANVTLLTGGAQPDWSPAGDRIVFVWAWQPGACDAGGYSYCGPSSHFYVINADGTNEADLGVGSGPAWRPGTSPTDMPPVARFSSTCIDLTCSFDGSASTDDYGVALHRWTFGDGSDGYLAPTHAYAAAGTYQVTLVVTDAWGHTNTATQSVTVTAPPPPPDAPPVARFTASCSGLACSFQSGTSSDDVGIVSRAWTFGDGTSAGDVVAPSHTYGAGGGTYAVTLTVTDTKGQSNSVTQSVTAVDQPPVARFTYTCGAPARGQTSCTFDGRSSSDDVGIVSHSWTLGSRGPATGAVVTASFKARSTQVITLTVTDAAGQASSVTQTITVN